MAGKEKEMLQAVPFILVGKAFIKGVLLKTTKGFKKVYNQTFLKPFVDNGNKDSYLPMR